MKSQGDLNQSLNFMIKCMLCCVNCLERVVKMINNHAYVEIAMRSTNFCTSAKNGLQIISSNFLRFGILHGLSEIVMTFVVLLITMCGGIIGYVLIIYFGPSQREFHGTSASLLVICIVTWSVASLFAHIWEATSDAILHCYCIDEVLEAGNAKHSTVKLNNAIASAERRQTSIKGGAGAAGYA
jgi:solute carrier family 44 protein 1 (choline transporter-like protein)